MKFQVFHVNPGEKLKKKDVNNDLSHFMSVFPSPDRGFFGRTETVQRPILKDRKTGGLFRSLNWQIFDLFLAYLLGMGGSSLYHGHFYQ